MHRQWKQGQVSWEEYKEIAQLCRDGVRKAKKQLELNLARDAKNNKKGFYRSVSQKRRVKESIPLLISKAGKLVTMDDKSLRYSKTILLQSSLETLLPTPLE